MISHDVSRLCAGHQYFFPKGIWQFRQDRGVVQVTFDLQYLRHLRTPLQHVRNLRIRATFVVFNVRKPFCDFYVWYVIIMLSLHLQNRKSSFRQYKTPAAESGHWSHHRTAPTLFWGGPLQLIFCTAFGCQRSDMGPEVIQPSFQRPRAQHEMTWRDVTWHHTHRYIYIYYIYILQVYSTLCNNMNVYTSYVLSLSIYIYLLYYIHILQYT